MMREVKIGEADANTCDGKDRETYREAQTERQVINQRWALSGFSF